MKTSYPKITEGLFIASIPIAGYFLAYLFERGYCDFYKIPTMLIDVSFINIISTSLAILGTYTLIFFAYDSIINPILSSMQRSIRWSFFRIFMITFILLGFSLVFNWSVNKSLSLFGPLIIGIIFLEFGFPLITQRKIKGYLNKHEGQSQTDAKDVTAFDKAAENLGPKIYMILFIFYLLSLATYFAGGIQARFKTEFAVSATIPNIVYLKKYGPILIGNQYDKENNTLSNQFIIEPINKNLFNIEKIGQLTPLSLIDLTHMSRSQVNRH